MQGVVEKVYEQVVARNIPISEEHPDYTALSR